ncbi:hypothetical protein HELRODRAFT_171941 [Helobdella robusta]|uniref:Uncharacterized protein n=1 Tax=Helobdella robusta TaxID=6412 RepID=T1F4V5_HELRO|nr:hypothetical protein HELRODRAFT_171941 [Helobdella robusta]ESO04936.1 hypothetical protein HELRODRAFT_171941 [Helobdella robusta]
MAICNFKVKYSDIVDEDEDDEGRQFEKFLLKIFCCFCCCGSYLKCSRRRSQTMLSLQHRPEVTRATVEGKSVAYNVKNFTSLANFRKPLSCNLTSFSNSRIRSNSCAVEMKVMGTSSNNNNNNSNNNIINKNQNTHSSNNNNNKKSGSNNCLTVQDGQAEVMARQRAASLSILNVS